MIKVCNLSGGYGSQRIIKNISFSVEKGEFLGILGPNGSGKTTLLNAMAGTLPAAEGSVHLAGKPVARYKPKELAQIMAVLPQKTSQTFTFTVKETVSFGRYPFQKGLFRQMDEKDEAIVQEVMEQTGVALFAQKSIRDLSGGEQQRVYLAQALAQQPDVLLLDEPTNFLDMSYQKELLDLVKRLTREKGLAAVGIFHDVNAASLYCDWLLFMKKGTAGQKRKPEHAMTERQIKTVYDTEVNTLVHHESPKPFIAIKPEQPVLKRPEIIPFASLLKSERDCLLLQTETPLRVLSASGIGSGFSWSRTFIQKQMPAHTKEELAALLTAEGFTLQETCAMASADKPGQPVCRTFEDGDLSVCISVSSHFTIWMFINGYLSDEAFVRAVMTAGEARGKALGAGEQAADGGVLIAASQETGLASKTAGEERLMQLIRFGANECVKEAVNRLK
ncbi:ABC transporter ATP-binding protein [Bacillus atrophaeus]|uniref:ABC transporter ATP-binding protein n=1 Tax=Bacillus atrophaeus TaxID=1452 RepID=UPI002280F0BB|nr:ATP-binding cassette domain-containing protein [Bacillus atrophaeus]MCY8839786.1 ATP-binding cassette domain-containing protein [Bacillus atrophaeus]MEC0802931.1 ATP-binding cassette domain-containing protein [Bacillus atrophaeus]MEC0854875.1 ATP-binding cassette domain-containing protein [Bacillus atrophaeus]MEC0858077.1 ATP-binding cassette domain-containing protein [Bacillus atrophaeus]MEC0860236.1 ATP-binding cassette domain-containing protein [Bacillus atrophaeus]